MTEIIKDYPPNIVTIAGVFPRAMTKGVMFAYDGAIYNPSGQAIPPQLIAHENVHLERQKIIGAEVWWSRYLTEPEFRYYEELLAHRAEYKWLIGAALNRQERRTALVLTAKRLASALYGSMVSVNRAKEDILDGVML